ncbi:MULTISPECIES: N-6 DNA methylase [Streptomyces]|uniref:N-6 DNA methylase n=1 Tax=Streptomyces TaxID=1883 RepID=UPI00102172DA|nr:N-6 DNA methylase [Streptomyces albidoflavus]RZF07158.1 restriction endonuclease subunit M [Streptomyces albidoflavus]
MSKSTAAAGRKPKAAPASHYRDGDEPLHREGNWVWAPLRQTWLLAKPEELVRQEFIHRMHTQWGYELGQMAQEVRATSGRKSVRADIVVAESSQALTENRGYVMVVETKAENVPIRRADYEQGESYARGAGVEFLVLHNSKTTSYFKLAPGFPGESVEIASVPKASELKNAKRLAEIRRSTKAFTRDEFQRLLFDCHCILRDNHKMDPGAAFDEISKILFIKMAFERSGRGEVFTTDTLREVAKNNLLREDTSKVLEKLFDITKDYYKRDQLFGSRDVLNISLATLKTIVKKLEKFNLSDTGEDVKGLAFERFLGDTFRGDLGQFFTPRPIVNFMVDVLEPKEGERVIDPAAGTGGFLITALGRVRADIEHDVQSSKAARRAELERQAKAEKWSPEILLEKIDEAYAELNKELDVQNEQGRLHRAAKDCIRGVDAETRAARTSKMNMIMHGDGHSGIYHHDGLLDTRDVYEGSFQVVLSNPPFGATVTRDQLVGSTAQTSALSDPKLVDAYAEQLGDMWLASQRRMKEAERQERPIIELFDIGRDPIAGPLGTAKVRPSRSTETLFVERCLKLLEPGGRMGIVLPDGILNNPSMSWLREYVEDHAKITAVVSVPQEVFASSKATVKTSLLFLKRFTDDEAHQFCELKQQAAKEVEEELAPEREALEALLRRSQTYDREDLSPLIDEISQLEAAGPSQRKELTAKRRLLRMAITEDDKARSKELARQHARLEAELERKNEAMVRQLAKQRFSYPVFMAEAQAAGITGTGETGAGVANDLPGILEELRKFQADPVGYREQVKAKLAVEDARELEPAL